MATPSFKSLLEVGPGFWNIRGKFSIAMGLVDIGTHMSIAKLSNGKYLVIDTIPLNDQIKSEIDTLTDNGTKIEAVVATHPFHTLSFPAFNKAYPKVEYYGTPRHLRNLNTINWAGSVNDCKVLAKWNPDIEMRIPKGSEFVDPKPEKSNHFSGVFVYHKASRTVHNDDTLMYAEHPGFLLKLAGFKADSLHFHVTMKGVGLQHHPEAPLEFRDWVKQLLLDWDFDNLCTAHLGNKIGGAHKMLEDLVQKEEPTFQKLHEKRKKDYNPDEDDEDSKTASKMNVEGCECG